MVGERYAMVLCERGRVQRVLRDWNQDAGIRRRDEHGDEEGDTSACAAGQEDVVRVRGVPIALWRVCQLLRSPAN